MEKSYTNPFNPVSFILLAEKSPDVFPKPKGRFVQNLWLSIDIFL